MQCFWQLTRERSHRRAIAWRWVVCAMFTLGIIDVVPLPATEGWVLKRDLVAEHRAASETLAPLDREQEQRRFGRLRRKGVLGVHRDGAGGVLRLTINHLLWHRLPAIQQENFLRRARQFFGASVVEIRNQRDQTVMARLTAAGELEIPFGSTTPAKLLNDSTLIAPSIPKRPSPEQ